MTWPHGGGMMHGRTLNPAGYGNYFKGNTTPTTQPWASGLASFANALAGQMVQKRQFEQQKQLQALQGRTEADRMNELMAKLQNAKDIDAANNTTRKGIASGNNATKIKTTDMNNNQSGTNEVFKNPKGAMQVIMSKYHLTGNPQVDAQTHGSALAQVKNMAENEFAQKAGFKGVQDPTYQAVKSDAKFQQAVATGQPYQFGGSTAGGKAPVSTVVTPSITTPSLSTGGTDNSPSYP